MKPNSLFSVTSVITALALMAAMSLGASNWPCQSPGIMDCSDLPGGDPNGGTICSHNGVSGSTQIKQCDDKSLFTCNGRNENCDLGDGCNVMVEYQFWGCQVWCVGNLGNGRPAESFMGWCAGDELEPGRAMNLKCSIEDEPCTGTTPEAMPPAEPIYYPAPGENPVPFQGPVFVPVEP